MTVSYVFFSFFINNCLIRDYAICTNVSYTLLADSHFAHDGLTDLLFVTEA